MAELVLYYPDIKPSPTWLRRALFFGDEISSIVPPGGSLPADLSFLRHAGVYEPRTIEHLEPAALALDLDAIERHVRERVTGSARTRIYDGKLNRVLLAEMTSRGLIARHGNDFEADMDVATAVLARAAQQLAADLESESRQSAAWDAVHTATESEFHFELGLGASQEREPDADSAALLLQLAELPSPGAEVPLPDVLRFRDAHYEQLLRLRSAVSAAVETARISNAGALTEANAEIVEGVRVIREMAARRDVTLKSLTAVAVVAAQLVAATDTAVTAANAATHHTAWASTVTVASGVLVVGKCRTAPERWRVRRGYGYLGEALRSGSSYGQLIKPG